MQAYWKMPAAGAGRPGQGRRQRRMLLTPVLVMLAAPGCAVSHAPQLVTVPQPGLRPVTTLDQVFDYRTAAATVAWIFQHDLGFPAFPATFRFYPHREAFEKALLDVGYDSDLARTTARTMTAVGGHRGVLLNDARLGALPWADRLALLAHEFGHSLQYEFGGGRRGTSDQWLREGFADWLSIRVLERLEVVTMASVRRERLRELRSAGRAKTPSLASLVTFPQWVRTGEQHGARMYALSFLAVDRLLERHGVAGVAGYFRRFAESEDRVANFRSAFGEDLETFESALTASLWRR
jgi:hypothetical protein